MAMLVAGLLMGAEAEAAARPADLVLTAGTVITLDGARSPGNTIVVRDGRIVSIGSAEGAKGMIGLATRRIDLPGATVVPGLGDAHVHVLGIGEAPAAAR
jgi:predicted amidohydrolase YtcJ